MSRCISRQRAAQAGDASTPPAHRGAQSPLPLLRSGDVVSETSLRAQLLTHYVKVSACLVTLVR